MEWFWIIGLAALVVNRHWRYQRALHLAEHGYRAYLAPCQMRMFWEWKIDGVNRTFSLRQAYKRMKLMQTRELLCIPEPVQVQRIQPGNETPPQGEWR